MPDLTGLDPVALLVAAVVLVFLQTALIIGIFIPGGKAAFLTGLTAALGHLPLWLSYGGIATAAITGATLGFFLGRSQGPRFLEHRLLAKRRQQLESAQALLRRRVRVALVGGRYVAALRATLPALAGASGIEHRQFQTWNVIGGFAWAAVSVGSGYLGGNTLMELSESGPVTWATVAAGVLAVLAAWLLWRRRRSVS